MGASATLEQLEAFLEQFPDTVSGNVAGAETLWRYSYGRRFQQLRRLAAYFRSIGVSDQRALRCWARRSDFERDFKGRVKGLAFAVYKWLVLRLGVDTIKPDVHVKAFLRAAAGRDFGDREAVAVLEVVAVECGRSAHKLDWAIWEYQRGRMAPSAHLPR